MVLFRVVLSACEFTDANVCFSNKYSVHQNKWELSKTPFKLARLQLKIWL